MTALLFSGVFKVNVDNPDHPKMIVSSSSKAMLLPCSMFFEDFGKDAIVRKIKELA